MGPFASRLLLESGLAPFFVTLLGISAVRFLKSIGLGSLFASVVTMPVAVSVTYLLVLGWPSGLFLDARIKVVIASFAGAMIGLGLHDNRKGAKIGLIAVSMVFPLWVGLPAFQQLAPESGLLIAPLFVALLFAIPLQPRQFVTRRRLIVLIVLAFGLAAIAAFARTLSYAELALALGSALIAVLLFGRDIALAPAFLSAASMILALMTALLLYTEASLIALLVLGAALLSETIDRALAKHLSQPMTAVIFPLACLLPLCAAVVVARVDAGSISLY